MHPSVDLKCVTTGMQLLHVVHQLIFNIILAQKAIQPGAGRCVFDKYIDTLQRSM